VNLARSGLGRLLVVDFDRLTASSLNRHPTAGPDDVGRLKSEILAEHLRRTCPETVVEVSSAFCHAEVLDDLLRPEIPPIPDLVIDAIDSLNPKVTLLAYCVAQRSPVLSSMGAAGRRDPTQVRVADLAQTRSCPLARQVRQRLRRRGILTGITCVYSEEVPAPPREPDLADRTCDRGRIRRRLPSQMSLPGVFGYTLASLALDRLAGGGAPSEDPVPPR
jgi:tRNA A37 threonylcarbamoyladenosine dehydratase